MTTSHQPFRVLDGAGVVGRVGNASPVVTIQSAKRNPLSSGGAGTPGFICSTICLDMLSTNTGV